MSTSIRFGFLILASSVVLFANGTFCRAQEKDAEIKDLRKKHSEVLDQALAEVTKRFNEGTMGSGQASGVKVEIFVSKLRLAETAKERIAALKEISENAKVFADVKENAFGAGQVYQYEALQARARAFEWRVQLLREESKSKE